MNGLKRIGFISTRLAGSDGVSLETEKWTTVLERNGYECFFFAGELDRRGANARIIPTAAFTHPEIVQIQQQCFDRNRRSRGLTRLVREAADRLNAEIHRCQTEFKIDLWIAENCLAIPMNIPLGLALTEFLAETCIPCIAHHHDFVWERERFATSGVADYIHTAFPPKLPMIKHVVINSVAEAQLSYRLGVSSTLIPNVMDFDSPPPPLDEFARQFRSDVGLQPDDWCILQPTRVVPRKKIEYSVELVRRLNDPRAKLVISHGARDEGQEYPQYIVEYAKLLNVPLLLVADWIAPERSVHSVAHGHRAYSIADLYQNANLVTYPSEYEGFGNAFLEAIYYQRMLLCNRYSIYRTDIEPKGFRVITMDGFVSDRTVDEARAMLEDTLFRHKTTEHNYELGRRHFSYGVLEKKLHALFAEIAGVR